MYHVQNACTTCMLHILMRPCCHSTASSRALPLSLYTCDLTAFCEKKRKNDQMKLEACAKNCMTDTTINILSPAVTAVEVVRMDYLELVNQVFPMDWHTEEWE